MAKLDRFLESVLGLLTLRENSPKKKLHEAPRNISQLTTVEASNEILIEDIRANRLDVPIELCDCRNDTGSRSKSNR